MYLHKQFRVFPPTSSGISRHFLRCYHKNRDDFQFDWIKTNDDIPLQLYALIELSVGPKQKIFMFSGFLGKYINGRNIGVSPPFPVIQYEMIYLPGKGRVQYPELVAQVLDDILEPSFVVPINVGSSDFIVNDVKDMVFVKFHVLSMQFLMRDGYASMDFTAQLNTAISKDRTTCAFLKEDNLGRKAMYAKLIETLRMNGDTDLVDDSLILQDLFQRQNRE